MTQDIANDEETKDYYISGLRAQYNNIAASHCNQSISWNKVVIGSIEYEENDGDGTVGSRQNNLAIKLPDVECSYKKFKENIRKLLWNSMEERYTLDKSDKIEDTRTSIIYLMKLRADDDIQRNIEGFS